MHTFNRILSVTSFPKIASAFKTGLLAIVASSWVCTIAIAQEEQTFVGGSVYSELGSDHFAVALFMDDPKKVVDEVIADQGVKRLEFRMMNDYSLRRWGQMWRQLLALNVPFEERQEFGPELGQFMGLFKGNFLRGDTVTITWDADSGTALAVNTVTLKDKGSPEIFAFLLRCLAGEVPPSESFKKELLNIDGAFNYQAESATKFNTPSPDRVQEAEEWRRQIRSGE